MPNAVELTADQAWLVGETVGAGSFPWVLAITPPYQDSAERARFEPSHREALMAMDVMDRDGRVRPDVADWVRVVCYCERWLELRYVGPSMQLMRGIVARRGTTTVVALRNAALVTFSAMTVDHPHAVVPILDVGLAGRPPARFPEFALPARVGARADDQLRAGADIRHILDYLGVPAPARPVVETVFNGPRSYLEVLAGQRRDGVHLSTDVGVGIVDTTAGRVLVSPTRSPDGSWVSTFAPGTAWSIAVAIDRLTATLPAGRWFPHAQLTRDFAAS